MHSNAPTQYRTDAYIVTLLSEWITASSEDWSLAVQDEYDGCQVQHLWGEPDKEYSWKL